jgi:hypothetical protein
MDTRGSFPGSKEAWTWSWPLTSIQCRSQECVELYLHSPNTHSWCGAQLKKHRDNFTLVRGQIRVGWEEAVPIQNAQGRITTSTTNSKGRSPDVYQNYRTSSVS